MRESCGGHRHRWTSRSYQELTSMDGTFFRTHQGGVVFVSFARANRRILVGVLEKHTRWMKLRIQAHWNARVSLIPAQVSPLASLPFVAVPRRRRLLSHGLRCRAREHSIDGHHNMTALAGAWTRPPSLARSPSPTSVAGGPRRTNLP